MTLTKGKAKTTYRIVCPNFGTSGHRTHVGKKRTMTLSEAKGRTAGADAHYQRLTEGESACSYYRSEIGWRVQKQTVTEWEDIDVL